MNLKKMLFASACVLFGGFAVIAISSCEDGSTNIEDYVGVQEADPYDPSKPIVISSFTPESGSVGQQVVIYGSNFGNDPDMIDLRIGGKKAVVVSVKGNCLYTFIPSKAFRGNIEITIDGKTATCPNKFFYERKMVVGTLCGYRNALDNQGWQEGPFDGPDGIRTAGFRNDGTLQFSPYNHDQLFLVYDQSPYWGDGRGVWLIDLKERYVTNVLPPSMFNTERLRTIDFIVDPFMYDDFGQLLGRSTPEWEASATPNQLRWREHLIVSADNGIGTSNWKSNSVYIIDRDQSGEFSSRSRVSKLACYQTCNGASVHPNGEIYFNSFTKGEVIRLDMEPYWQTIEEGVEWNPNVQENTEAFEILYTVQDSGWEFQIDIHPSGNYAYIVVINHHYICRTDYDWKNKRFLPAYQVAGQLNKADLVDGVGKQAKMNRPYQGTFVLNDEYVKEGKSDPYDFYFIETENHAVRVLTPEGIVKTYAGANENSHADGNRFGSEDGELRDVARFNRPSGIINDYHIDKITGEKTLIFYIVDGTNRRMRTITMEEPEDEDMEPETPEEP